MKSVQFSDVSRIVQVRPDGKMNSARRDGRSQNTDSRSNMRDGRMSPRDGRMDNGTGYFDPYYYNNPFMNPYYTYGYGMNNPYYPIPDEYNGYNEHTNTKYEVFLKDGRKFDTDYYKLEGNTLWLENPDRDEEVIFDINDSNRNESYLRRLNGQY